MDADCLVAWFGDFRLLDGLKWQLCAWQQRPQGAPSGLTSLLTRSVAPAARAAEIASMQQGLEPEKLRRGAPAGIEQEPNSTGAGSPSARQVR